MLPHTSAIASRGPIVLSASAPERTPELAPNRQNSTGLAPKEERGCVNGDARISQCNTRLIPH